MQPPASQAEEPSRLGLQLSLRGELHGGLRIFFVLIAALLAFCGACLSRPMAGAAQAAGRRDSCPLVADLKKERLLGWLQQCRQEPALLHEPVINDILRLRHPASGLGDEGATPKDWLAIANSQEMRRLSWAPFAIPSGSSAPLT